MFTLYPQTLSATVWMSYDKEIKNSQKQLQQQVKKVVLGIPAEEYSIPCYEDVHYWQVMAAH